MIFFIVCVDLLGQYKFRATDWFPTFLQIEKKKLLFVGWHGTTTGLCPPAGKWTKILLLPDNLRKLFSSVGIKENGYLEIGNEDTCCRLPEAGFQKQLFLAHGEIFQ